MKLALVLLACALLPACAASPSQEPPGMPLDKELIPGNPEATLTSVR